MSESTTTKPSDAMSQLTSMIAQRKPAKKPIPIPPRPTPSPSNPPPLDGSDLDRVEVVQAPRREGAPPRPHARSAELTHASSGTAPAAPKSTPEMATESNDGVLVENEKAPAGPQRLVLLARDQIIALPDQPRTSGNVKVHIGDLVDSIAKIGLRVPLQGKWDEAVGKYQLFDGHRRLLALDQLIPTRPDLGEDIPMVVLADAEVEAWRTLEDHERMFLLSLVVNTVRQDLNKADRGRAYESLIAKFTVDGTARLLGISPRSVRRNRKAAKDADQHTQRGETFGQPTWVPKYSVRMVKSVLKLSTDRWEPAQREVMSKWLRSVARVVERGEAKLPAFPTGGGHDEAAPLESEQAS